MGLTTDSKTYSLNDAASARTWAGLSGKSSVTWSPLGIKQGVGINGGADYGPDTPGTSSNGLKEAYEASLSSGLPVVYLGATTDPYSSLSIPAGALALPNKTNNLLVLQSGTSGAAVLPTGGSPSTSVVGPDNYGGPAVVGTATTYSRGDHDHGLNRPRLGNPTSDMEDVVITSLATNNVLSWNGTDWVNVAPTGGTPATSVTGPDAYGAAAVVGTSAAYARGDHDHGLPTSAAFVQYGENIYYLYYNGTDYFLRKLADGTATSGTSGSSLLNTLLSSAGTTPKAVILDPAVSITDAAVTIGQSNVYLGNQVRGYIGTNGAFIGQIKLTNAQPKQQNITIDRLTFNELDMLPTTAGTNIDTVDIIDPTIISNGTSGGAGLVIDGSSGGYVQYCHVRGHTFVQDSNWEGSTSSYPGGWFTMTGTGNGNAHITFDDVEVLHTGTTQVQSSIHFIGGSSATQFPTIVFTKLDANMANATSGYYSFVRADVSSAAINTDISILMGRAEIHATSGIGGAFVNVVGSSTVANVLSMDVFKFYQTGTPFQMSQSSLPTFAGHSLAGLNLHNWAPKTSSDVITWGTQETATFPIYLGMTGAVGAPTGTGAIIANPVTATGSILSVGGTGAWAAGTTYTCGGTPLIALVTGTTTLKTSDGTTLLSAASLTNSFIRLEVGMTLLVATGGTTVFYKGV